MPAGICHSNEISSDKVEGFNSICKTNMVNPLVMKVVGPVHKSDVGGVVLNVKDEETIRREFDRTNEDKRHCRVQTFKCYLEQKYILEQ